MGQKFRSKVAGHSFCQNPIPKQHHSSHWPQNPNLRLHHGLLPPPLRPPPPAQASTAPLLASPPDAVSAPTTPPRVAPPLLALQRAALRARRPPPLAAVARASEILPVVCSCSRCRLPRASPPARPSPCPPAAALRSGPRARLLVLEPDRPLLPHRCSAFSASSSRPPISAA
jgi:hypothetical protein